MNRLPDGILLVADENTIRDSLIQSLSLKGSVRRATGGGQAIALVDDTTTVIIFSAHLPDMAAQNFITIIKQIDTNQAIALIVIGNPEYSAELEQCLEAGADDFLTTPISLGLLETRVSLIIEYKRLVQKNKHRIENEELLKIEHDIQIARRIQAGFLPEILPKPAGWDIAARFQPAREVAGDFYDSFMLSQNRRLGFVIADVVDKGVPAALFMALVRSLTRAFAQQNYSFNWTDFHETNPAAGPFSRGRGHVAPSTGTMALKNAVQLTNKYITENHLQDNMFATLFFGMLDPTTGLLAYINAGHNPPVVCDKNGHLKQELKPTNMAVGMMPETNYTIEFAKIDPGDFVFCYTDGVTEARNKVGEFFMEERLFEALAKPIISAQEVVDRVYSTVQSFIADATQFDDITMITVARQLEASE
jgi:sigma-B regulation protein RsbU (phosphoserine phosphatase)